MHQGEDLHIYEKMVPSAISYLTNIKIDNTAAYGLLRLAYNNDISFVSFDIELLRNFEIEYEQAIPRLFKSLPLLK
jgi:hypothetical protein